MSTRLFNMMIIYLHQFWPPETGELPMLLHRPVKLKSSKNQHSMDRSSNNRSTKCAEQTLSVMSRQCSSGSLGTDGSESQGDGAKCQMRDVES